MSQIDAIYNPAGDSQADIAKAKLNSLADAQDRTAPEICRLVVRLEAADDTSEIQALLEELKDLLLQWRAD